MSTSLASTRHIYDVDHQQSYPQPPPPRPSTSYHHQTIDRMARWQQRSKHACHNNAPTERNEFDRIMEEDLTRQCKILDLNLSESPYYNMAWQPRQRTSPPMAPVIDDTSYSILDDPCSWTTHPHRVRHSLANMARQWFSCWWHSRSKDYAIKS
jgi:hypothetical protein